MPQWLIFIGIYGRAQTVTYTCCPNCMRKHILARGFTYNIITGNLLWLILSPWFLILLIMSYTRGHSFEIQQMIDEQPNKNL